MIKPKRPQKYSFARHVQPTGARSLKRVLLRSLGTAFLFALAALAAKYNVGAENWPDALDKLSPSGLILLIFAIPLAVILIQFFEAFFAELNVLAQGGGKSAAHLVVRVPVAIANVSRRAWNRVGALWMRWHFARNYRRRLFEDYGLFNDRGLGLINAARLDLEKVYVDLQISNQVVQARNNLLGSPLRGRQSIWRFLDSVKRGRGLVLLGSPGSGKTTLLQYLLLVFASRRHRRYSLPAFLPIFVELRLLKLSSDRSAPTSLAAAIREYWLKHTRIADLMKAEPPDWLEHQLHSRRVLLLFDGLDEVPQANRADISRWVNSQIDQYRLCTFVTTSRPGGYVATPLSSAAVLEIQPFTREQINEFIDRWYLANEIVATGKGRDEAPVRRRAEEEANDLRRRLRANANLQDLTVNPLLLTMVCMVHRYHGALPGSRAQLYGEICQVLLERWRQGKDIHDDLNGEQKLAVLRPLAHEFMCRETREMGEVEIGKLISEQLEFVGYKKQGDDDAGARFLRAIQFGSGLLLEKEAGVWSFAHKTFQEYLTSEFWLRNPDDRPTWAIYVGQDWWREALLLYVARADASDIVQAALDIRSPASWALGFQCLTEAHSMRPDVRHRAETLLREALHSPDREVFTPAARSMHYLRQSHVRRISESVEQRVSLVTQAEYQLFLDEMAANERAKMLPAHWTADRFLGDPEAPIVGVWPWQADIYAASASRGAFSSPWRLPAATEKVILQEQEAVYWLQSAGLGFERRGVISPTSDRATTNYFPEGLRRDIHVNLADAHSIASAISKALWIAPSQEIDVAFALANSLNLAIAHTFALDTTRAQELARIASFDRMLVRSIVTALRRERSHRQALVLNVHDKTGRASASKRRTVADLIYRVRHQKSREADYSANSGVWEQREALAVVLEQLVDTHNRWSGSAHDWRNYARCLIDIAIPYHAGSDLADVMRFERSLRLLNERECGRAAAYEGILLVRDSG